MTNLQSTREPLLHALREMLKEIELKDEGYELICQDLLEVLVLRLMRQTGLSFLTKKPEPAASPARSAPLCGTI